MVSFRNLSSFLADTKSLLSSITRCCRRSKCKYRCRVWQPNVDTLPNDDNYTHASDDLCFHIRVCYVSVDVLNCPNPEQVHRAVLEFERKLFGTEFNVGRSSRRVPRRHRNDCLDAIAGYVQRKLASVEHPCTVHIGSAFMVTRYRLRRTLYAYVDDEELDYDEEEQAIIQASIEEDNVFGGVGASAESVDALEAVTLESCVESVTRCAVCLEKFSDWLEGEDPLRRMPCQHVYHKDCIVRWLEESHLCPLCRFPMPCSTSLFVSSSQLVDPNRYDAVS
jgi:hypothetical protein